MKLSMKNMHWWMFASLMVICFATMVWAWWVNDCHPGGDGIANGICILSMAIGLVACGLADLMQEENK